MTGSGERAKLLPETISPYEKVFQKFEECGKGKPSPWITTLRRTALSKFHEIGFPTPKLEDWKYTNVTPYVRTPFHFSFGPLSNGLDEKQISALLVGETGGPVLVFVNGFLSKRHPRIPSSSVRTESLREAIKTDAAAKRHLGQIVPLEQNGFTALNTAFLGDGAFIHLPEGAVSEKPIHLVFIALPHEENLLIQPRNLVVLEKKSRATLIETYSSFEGNPYFTNAVTEIHVGEGAFLNHLKIQKESEERGCHVSTTEIHLEKGGRYTSLSLSLGAKLARENLNVILDQERTECELDGLYLLSEGRHVDHHTLIDHRKPRGRSRQLYKGVLAGKSTAVFNGKVHVRKEAAKSDASQTNKNILLSEEATCDTKPQLEIDTDDVQCTHGAAVGRLDEDQFFYLQSRGIRREAAQNILTHAFASEVIARVQDEAIRSRLTEWIWEWLEKDRTGKGGEWVPA